MNIEESPYSALNKINLGLLPRPQPKIINPIIIQNNLMNGNSRVDNCLKQNLEKDKVLEY